MMLRRTPLRRSARPLARVGRKARRERSALARFRAQVRANASGLCEGWIADICETVSPCQHVGTQAHHVWPEDRDRGRHEAARGVWLCAAAHRWVHEHPAEASALGLLRPQVSS